MAEKMKSEVEGILIWACEGLQRLAANNFKFTESQRTKDNREAVKRDKIIFLIFWNPRDIFG